MVEIFQKSIISMFNTYICIMLCVSMYITYTCTHRYDFMFWLALTNFNSELLKIYLVIIIIIIIILLTLVSNNLSVSQKIDFYRIHWNRKRVNKNYILTQPLIYADI